MDKNKFLDEIQSLVQEAEAELHKNALFTVPISTPVDSSFCDMTKKADSSIEAAMPENPNLNLKNVESEYKNPHAGHRARVKKSADADPDFTTFSDHEVLEYLLFNTIPRVDVNELAHYLIDTFGSFSGVLNANVNELKKVVYFSKSMSRSLNIGEETARSLTSVLPAARKAEMSRLRNNAIINNIAQAVNYMHPFFMNRSMEYVYLTCLNNSDRVISVDLVAVGDTNFSTVEVKKIIEIACRHKANKVLIAHNHPGGTLEPSQDDLDVTTLLVIALLSMNVVLVDHILFTSEGYYSFFAKHHFEGIYGYVDSIFKTNLVKEIKLKPINYRAGVYLKGTDDEVSENVSHSAYSENREELSYSLGHPNPRNLKVRR